MQKDVSLLKALFKQLSLAVAVIFLLLVAVCIYQMHVHADGIPVLNYHQINDKDENSLTIHTDQFEAEMKYLADNGYHAITPEELLDAWDNGKALPEKPIIITFDDGYADNYKNAYPILKKYNLKGTIFVVTDYLNTYPNYLTWSMASEMLDSGVINIESHTLSHAELDKLETREELDKQLRDSKLAIDWHLHKKAAFIAYPCGSFNKDIEESTLAAGYKGAFTVHYGLAEPTQNRLQLDRVPIFGSNSHTMLRFKLRLLYAPIFGPLDELQRNLRNNGHDFLARLLMVP